MRAVIQRVTEAQVLVEGNIVGSIGPGLLVLLGIHKEDTAEDTLWLAKKIALLRLFSDAEGKMNLSVKEVGGQILVVSQFTLYGACEKGRRPDFLNAAPGEVAEPIYNKFVKEVSLELGQEVATGTFGAHMAIHLINDGPVTLILDDHSR